MNKPIRSILIDDEKAAHLTMRNLLQRVDNIEHAGEASNLPEGVKLIRQLKPDLVFLDIEMPGYSGLELLDFFNEDEIDFQFVFTTAYSEYAIHAFEMSAVDYLLKPIQLDKLRQAVAKVQQSLDQGTPGWQKYRALSHNMGVVSNKRLAISLADEILFLDIDTIQCIEADGAYTKIYTDSSQPLMTSKNLRNYEMLLTTHPEFFRCHRSFLVNMNAISRFIKTDGGTIWLRNGHSIPLSHRSREAFFEKMRELNLM